MGKDRQVNQFSINGRVVFIGKPEQYTTKAGNTKTNRILVLEVYRNNYQNEVSFTFRETNMWDVNEIKEGEWVAVTFCLGGNRAKDGSEKWYNNLEGLSVIKG